MTSDWYCTAWVQTDVKFRIRALGISWQELGDQLQIPGFQSRLFHCPSCFTHEEWLRLAAWLRQGKTGGRATVSVPLLAVERKGIIHFARHHRYSWDKDSWSTSNALCDEFLARKTLFDPAIHVRSVVCPICWQRALEANEQEGIEYVIPEGLPLNE